MFWSFVLLVARWSNGRDWGELRETMSCSEITTSPIDNELRKSSVFRGGGAAVVGFFEVGSWDYFKSCSILFGNLTEQLFKDLFRGMDRRREGIRWR